MPIYRSITVKLHSQFDIETFPEYIPRPRSHYLARGIPAPDPVPPFDDEQTSTCNVYVPVYPNSQFWLSYAIAPPVPEDQHFLFKLYINGAHIVSWSTGKENIWKGKTMFALFETEEGGKKRVEKRILCFTAPDGSNGKWNDVEDLFDEKACLELKVHRAVGRKRAERQVEAYGTTEHGRCERGVSLISAGRAGSEQPKRFYKFALIDPIDKPFATFRYYYRTWAQIHQLGLSEEMVIEDGESNELPVIEPYDTEVSLRGGKGDNSQDATPQDMGNAFQACHDGADDPPSSPLKNDAPIGSPAKRSTGYRKRSDEQVRPLPRLGSRTLSAQRLSVPPSCKLDPPEPASRALPAIPQKQDPLVPATETSYQPHPVYPLNDWDTRTPSPVQSLRETISTPTISPRPKRGLTPSGWLSAVAGAWRRRGTPSNLSDDDSSRAASRSDSRAAR